MAPLLPHFRCPHCQRSSLEARGLSRPPTPGSVATGATKSFLTELRTCDVDLDALRETVRMCGMRAEFRALAWQLLLGYVPGEVAVRAPTLRAYRHKYHTWAAEHFREYNQATSFGADEQSLLHQIAVDVPRTHCRALPWLFSEPRMRDSLTRVLYVFATVFPRVGYFQGLNEVPIPLYVCYMSTRGPLTPATLAAVRDSELQELEADVFWSLFRILEPVFRCTGAVAQKIHAVDQTQWEREIMELCDAPLCRHLETLNVDFMFFSFRWNVMFLIREFADMDVLLYSCVVDCAANCCFAADVRAARAVFDTYILEEGSRGFAVFHPYLCCALLQQFRTPLLAMSDSTDALLYLQALPTEGWTVARVRETVAQALALRRAHSEPTAAAAALLATRPPFDPLQPEPASAPL